MILETAAVVRCRKMYEDVYDLSDGFNPETRDGLIARFLEELQQAITLLTISELSDENLRLLFSNWSHMCVDKVDYDTRVKSFASWVTVFPGLVAEAQAATRPADNVVRLL